MDHWRDPIERTSQAATGEAADQSQTSEKYCYAAPEPIPHYLIPALTDISQSYDCSLHRSPENGSTSQLLGPVEQNPSLINMSYQLPYLTSSPLLEVAEHLKTNREDIELCSSSPGFESPDRAVFSGEQSDGSPEQMTVSSLLGSPIEAQFSDGFLHQSLELILASPKPVLIEQAQPGYNPSCTRPQIIAPTPIPAHSTVHPQFIGDYLQDSSVVTPTSLVVNPATQSRSGDEEEEEEDISALEYARKSGISRNYLEEPYLTSPLHVFDDRQNGLSHDSHLSQFDLIANVNTDERPTLSKDAALLIAFVSHEETSDWLDSTMLRMIEIKKRRNFRLELPLLKSDNETDCKTFAQREGFEIELKNVRLPLEMLDEQNNESLELSSSLWGKGDDVLQNLKKERLEVSRNTLVYLQNILKKDWTEDDERAVWAKLQTYKKNTALEPVTPPMLPLTSPAQLFEPSLSDPVFEIPILSDPPSLMKEGLEALEKQIYNEDVPTPIKNAREHHHTSSDTLIGSPVVKLAEIYSPAASLDEAPIHPIIETKRLKREELKVEETLTPAKPHELPDPVRFSDKVMKCPVEPCSPPKDPFEASYFEEAFGDAHQKAMQMCEQETLIPADTMARVQVPMMDFSLPSPPWKTTRSNPHSSSGLALQLASMKDSLAYGLPTWPLNANGKLKIRYNPFPHELAKVALEEDVIVDDSTWKAFFQGPGDDEVIDTSTLTRKPPGLRILKDEDDDEIETGPFEIGPLPDISYLVKKRKMEIEERGSGESPAGQDESATSVKQPPRKRTLKLADFDLSGSKLQSGLMTKGGGMLLMGGAFSVGNSVENFLEIRGAKKAKLGDSSFFTKTSEQAKIHQTLAKTTPQPELLSQLPIRNSPDPKAPPTPLPAPTTNIPNTSVNVIVASTLLKHRVLIRNIEQMFPNIILIERDFLAHNTTTWMPGSIARSPIASPLASEADIIVSPLLGIIIVNLQRIKQKPLPGQKTKSVIRNRLEKVSAKYEKLLVLVTEGREDETTRELDDGDCIAISDFVAFSLRLQNTCAINVQFVGGGEATLAKWVVSAIARCSSSEELLADETHWELFLRRAGLNAFAAQHVLTSLKAPDSADVVSTAGTPARFGLAAFAEMGTEQRVARFGTVCGKRLMATVSAVVEARWS